MSTTTIAGKPSNTIGEKDSTLVLRGSSIKIQWGNKFIDLIKNGKINSDSQKLLKTADSTEELTTDGLYLVGDSVWAVIGGTKVQLSGDSTTTYVSYLTEQKDITGEQKERALTNIGFYYETLEEANAAGLTSGIIYVKGDNKLYFIKDGILTEYINTQNTLPSTENTESTESTENLYIEGNSLWVGNDKYITCDDNIYTNELLILEQGLQSSNASSKYGYRLYMKNGQSYLEVDNIIQRNLKEIDITIQPTKYYQEENIILQAVEETETEIVSNLIITLLYSDKYKIGDILTTSILLDNEVEYTNEDGEIDTKTEKIITSLDFKIVSIGENNTYSVSTNSDKITPSNISQLVNKPIYYKQGELPVARISDHNYDLFKPYTDQTLENINLRIGSLQELEVSLLGKKISEYTKKDLGIYSDNAFLKNSYLFDTSQYNTVFKNVNNIYPKYDEGWFIPDTSDDQTIVTSLWVNNKIEPIWTEINVIKESIKSIEDLEDRLDQAELDINQAESDIDELEKSVKNLEDSLDSLGDSIPDVSGLISDVSTLKSNVTTITTNISTLQTDLNSAESKITTAETAISTLKTDVSNLKNADISINNEIDDIWEEIDNITDSSNTANLQEQIDELKDTIKGLNKQLETLRIGDYYNPVLLMSGYLYSTDSERNKWYFNGHKKELISDVIVSRLGGKLEVTVKGPRTETEVNLGTEESPDIFLYIEEYIVRITSVSANQYSSKHTREHGNENSYREDNHGAHWFETRHNSNSIFSVREFHQNNDHNDTWQSGSWNDYTCNYITVNVFGYITFSAYYEDPTPPVPDPEYPDEIEPINIE